MTNPFTLKVRTPFLLQHTTGLFCAQSVDKALDKQSAWSDLNLLNQSLENVENAILYYEEQVELAQYNIDNYKEDADDMRFINSEIQNTFEKVSNSFKSFLKTIPEDFKAMLVFNHPVKPEVKRFPRYSLVENYKQLEKEIKYEETALKSSKLKVKHYNNLLNKIKEILE